jgi:hypothetical protein
MIIIIFIIIIIIMVFNCPFTYMEICETLNIKLWERKINFETINQKRLNYFNISDKKDYILLIKTNINNPDKLNEIYKLYKNNQIIASEELEASEKQKQELLYINSISKINTNITIRLLLSSDSDNALKLYKEYKQDDNLNDYISDYILKNQIYGIFINNNLIGCAIINTKLFIIDDNDNKKLTYYIQEIFITNDFKNMKYGEKLFNYILNKCPSNLKYISFMTNVDNKAMYKIAEKNNFILQKKSSGDINNTSLFIFKIV